MLVKPDWTIFKENFSENPTKNFEWLCYQLFCREFHKESGIFRFYNQPSLETEPIQDGNDIIGFQAKYYTVPLKERKNEIKNTIDNAKRIYKNISKIYFYIHTDWNCSSDTKETDDRRTQIQEEIEEYARNQNIEIDWKTESFFESPFVTVDNSDISQYFFSKSTNQYYEKIRNKQKIEIDFAEKDKYKTILKISDNTDCIINNFSLFEFINSALQSCELHNFKDILVKGSHGISKTVEMKFAYNMLLENCSSNEAYHRYTYLPTPYFFELKYFNDGLFDNISDETPLIFLDGLDEISDEKIIALKKQMKNLRAKISGCRFIISGRDAAFIKEFVDEKYAIAVKLLPFIDSNVQELMWYYKGSPLESLITIPFYRNFAAEHKDQQLKTYKDFINALIDERLKEDKIKRDISNNISGRKNHQSNINLEIIKLHTSEFCYNIFKNNITIFSQELIKSFLDNEEELDFLLKSSLINYTNENEISFYSNIYYEYFLAYYFSRKRFSVIQKDLFLTNKKINVKYVNIISILLNLLDTKEIVYKKLSTTLERDNICYILLTDFDKLTAIKRFEWYTKIINYYNSNKKLIYYARFVGSFDLLANTDSLADKLNDLLPDDFQSNAIDMHLNCINCFLQKPTEEKIREFSNAVILLGTNDRKIWNTDNAQKIKDISISLIKFFFFHPLAKKVKGILSARFVFNWYGIYNWIDRWKLDDWHKFIKSIYSQTPDDFYLINDYIDHEIKMSLFIYLYRNEYIWKLYVPLSNYMLSNSRSFVPTATPEPDEIDDKYKVKTVNFGGDDYFLTAIIKQEKIDINGILEILKKFSAKKISLYNLGFEAQELLNEIKKQFKDLIPTLTLNDVNELYEIGVNYLTFENGLHFNVLDEFIKLFNDDIKYELANKIINDFISNKYKVFGYVYRTLAFMFELRDNKISLELLEKLNNPITVEIYKNIIAYLKEDSFQEHTLHTFAVQEFPKLYPLEAEKHNKHIERIENLEKSIHQMEANEADIIINEGKILTTIDSIYKYLNIHPDFQDEKTEKGKLISLRPDYIKDNVTYDFSNEYKIPEIFSEFVVKLLVNEAFNESEEVNRNSFEEYIKEVFSNEKYFWRFFFYHFVESYTYEQTIDFLDKNPLISERIQKSMELEIPELINEQDLSFYDGGANRTWVYPFVWYISNLYNNVLPDWFNKEALLKFIAFPAWALGAGIGIHSGNIFNWQSWNSVFEWILSVSDYSKEDLIDISIKIYPKIKYDQSKTQIISYLIENLDSYPQFKNEIIKYILQETIFESNKEYDVAENITILNCNILQSFWNKNNDSSYVPKLMEKLPFEKYQVSDKNYTRVATIEYICRLANFEQKIKLIKKVKKINIQNDDKKILLAKLGDEKYIILLINDYLSGGNYFESIFYGSNAFGSIKPSKKLLKKYIKLFEYSTQMYSERRNNLQTLSINAIKNASNIKNYKLIKKSFMRIISNKLDSNEYIEYYEDILNEIEQKVFLEKKK